MASFRPRWIDRELLWLTFAIPFNIWGVDKLIAPAQSTNEKAVDFILHIGFTIETTIKDVFPDGDMLIMSMYRKSCRFLNMRRPQHFTFESYVDGKK